MASTMYTTEDLRNELVRVQRARRRAIVGVVVLDLVVAVVVVFLILGRLVF